MNRTNLTRWGLATLVMIGLGALNAVTGNSRGTSLLLFGMLIFVYLYGGHGRPSDAGGSGPSQATGGPRDSVSAPGLDSPAPGSDAPVDDDQTGA